MTRDVRIEPAAWKLSTAALIGILCGLAVMFCIEFSDGYPRAVTSGIMRYASSALAGAAAAMYIACSRNLVLGAHKQLW